MTAICPGPDCPMCAGPTAGGTCSACDSGDFRIPCTHDVVERHQARIAILDSIELPKQDRTPTRPMSKLIGKQISIGGASGMAEVFRMLAEIIDEHGEVLCTFEAPRKPTDG